MAEGADGGTLNPANKKPAARRKSRQNRQKVSGSRVSLEKVLGISALSSSGLTSDPNTGLIAYPAGCVIVLLHPLKNRETHIINSSRKPFSALAFSHDGKHLVTGESGHMPCVRVWEVGGGQVAEVQSHKYGVSCVAFSPNSCYIVSVGYQHDMTVSVWDWRKGSVIASNKVSSRVASVSFSQDNSYFVTAGNRHVKFWYLDASKERRVNSTVPLIGRSGLLGDHKNCVFSGVACGRGLMASSTYCITSSALLCLFNSRRHLEAWVDLKTTSASCLAVSEDLVFCGCADGVVRVFGPSNLQYIATLQRPHRLGVDLTRSPQPSTPGAQYPDTLALTFDPTARRLTCVYNDHSVYVWDVRDVRNVRKLYSALYHSSCVWSLQVYPDLCDPSQACLPPSSFLTCSSDNTIRLWNPSTPAGHGNFYSNDLLRIVYMGEDTQHLQAEGERVETAGADGKAGIRVLAISPDGRHLAAGDRSGNLRIFGLEFLDELVKIEAHDSEVLCLEFSPTSTGMKLLASASRDRLIHVFNLEKNYGLEQTLNHHSASITAVKFAGESPEVRMVSCGADKSIYFQTAEQVVAPEGVSFCRTHHVVEKTTLYDMDLDSSKMHVTVACQDRNVRVYDVVTGKMKKCLKGSSSEEGALLKVHMDPSGSYLATSCSDKNIAIFDYESGECVATLFGHSEIVTCMRFSHDCRHLITVSGDSCVFVWRLDAHMTSTMRKRRGLRRLTTAPAACSSRQIRRETFITGPSSQLPLMEEEEDEACELRTPARPDANVADTPQLQTNGKLPLWFRKLQGQDRPSSSIQSDTDLEPRQGRGRWAEQLNPLTICSHCSPSPTKNLEEEEHGEEDEDYFHPQSLESLLGDEEVLQTAGEDASSYILRSNDTSKREFDVQATNRPPCPGLKEVGGQEVEPMWHSHLSPDSACSEGSAGSLEPQQDADTDSLSQSSSVGSSGLEEDEDRNSLQNHFDTLSHGLTDEKFDTDLGGLQPPEEKNFLNPRLSISTRFLSRFQERVRAWPSRAPPPASILSRVSEESCLGNTLVHSVSGSDITSNESTNKEQSVRDSRSVVRHRVAMSHHRPPHHPPRRRHTAVLVQCRQTLGENTSRMPREVQQGAPGLSYQGTTASSRAKVSQDPPTSSQEDGDMDLDQTSSITQVPAARCPLLATPTEVRSPGGPRTWSVSSIEDTLTNQTLILSPAPSTTPTPDVITTDISSQNQLGGAEGRTQTECYMSGAQVCTDAATASSPLLERLRPPQTGAVEEPVSLQQCQQLTNELRQAARRTLHLYRQLSASSCGGSERRLHMNILLEAFDAVESELWAVLQADRRCRGGSLEDAGTTSLLERYSELLVQMTQNKLNRI
ncbi:WD repeat-containing protein 62 [Aulostomus maculatus]